MKKPYSAPELFAESFRVSEHIAAACIIPGTPVGNNGEYEFTNSGGSIVLFRSPSCSIDVEWVEDYIGLFNDGVLIGGS